MKIKNCWVVGVLIVATTITGCGGQATLSDHQVASDLAPALSNKYTTLIWPRQIICSHLNGNEYDCSVTLHGIPELLDVTDDSHSIAWHPA